jgi:protein-tyrosine phosphatase
VIDLHAHVLPGIDDGPDDEEDALALVEEAAAQGIRVIAATPHLRHDFPGVRPAALEASCAALQARVPAEWGIRIVSGGEADLTWALASDPERLRLASYRGRGTDLLVETPYGELTAGFEVGLHELRARGYRVLLAHPELNPTLQKHPERLQALTAEGVLVQITATSLLHEARRSRRAGLARALVRDGLAHVIASDAHSGRGWRPSRLADGVAAAHELAGARAQWMVTVAPAAILAGTPLPPAP